jgi:hypothetical protein
MLAVVVLAPPRRRCRDWVRFASPPFFLSRTPDVVEIADVVFRQPFRRMSLTGHGRRFGTMRSYFSTAAVSRPSAGATAGLLSATSGHPRDSLPERQQHQFGTTFSRLVCRDGSMVRSAKVRSWPGPRHGWKPESVLAVRPRMRLVLQPSLPCPNSCPGTSPHQQGRGTASAHSTGRTRYFVMRSPPRLRATSVIGIRSNRRDEGSYLPWVVGIALARAEGGENRRCLTQATGYGEISYRPTVEPPPRPTSIGICTLKVRYVDREMRWRWGIEGVVDLSMHAGESAGRKQLI